MTSKKLSERKIREIEEAARQWGKLLRGRRSQGGQT